MLPTQVLLPSSLSSSGHAVTFGSAVCLTLIRSELYPIRLLLTWARPCSSRLSDSPPFRPASTGSRSATFVAALLLLAGDVAVNPGPSAAARSAVSTCQQLTVHSNIGVLNCCSAGNKTALIHDLISTREFDALFLSETWFNDNTPAAILNDVAPPHYAALHVPRPLTADGPSQGGGLAVVYRQSVVVRRHPLADKYRATTFEMQLVRVGLPPLTHAVIHVYRPQWMSTVPDFIDELTGIIASLSVDCNDNIILCGDLNCPGVDSTHVDDRLERALDALDLTQFVNSATRGDNLLDVLASSTSTLVSGVKVDDAGLLSDHRLVSANLTIRCPKANVAYSWRKLRDVDTRQFEAALRQSELFLTPATTTDAFTDQLTRVVTSQLDAIAPIRHSSRRPPKPISKWLSTEAVAAKRERRRLERRWLSTRDDRDRLKYRRACRSANKLINMSRRDYFKKRLLSVKNEPISVKLDGLPWNKPLRKLCLKCPFHLKLYTIISSHHDSASVCCSHIPIGPSLRQAACIQVSYAMCSEI